MKDTRVYNYNIHSGCGRTWGDDYGDISLPWQEVETGHYTASWHDLHRNAWSQLMDDGDYYRANNYESY